MVAILTVIGLSGCTQYLLDAESSIPGPPSLAEAAPRLSNLEITPSVLRAGQINELTVRVQYEDWNRDVGPDRVRVRREVEAVSGNLAFQQPVVEYTVPVELSGRSGTFQYNIDIFVPDHGYGRLRFSISIYDQRGNRSASLSAILSIQ